MYGLNVISTHALDLWPQIYWHYSRGRHGDRLNEVETLAKRKAREDQDMWIMVKEKETQVYAGRIFLRKPSMREGEDDEDEEDGEDDDKGPRFPIIKHKQRNLQTLTLDLVGVQDNGGRRAGTEIEKRKGREIAKEGMRD